MAKKATSRKALPAKRKVVKVELGKNATLTLGKKNTSDEIVQRVFSKKLTEHISKQIITDNFAKPKTKYKRILLKLSGEALMGNKQFGIDHDILSQYALEIKGIVD